MFEDSDDVASIIPLSFNCHGDAHHFSVSIIML